MSPSEPDWSLLAAAVAARRRPIMDGLADFLRLDTVSQKPDRVRAGAEWLAGAMRARGLEARIMETGGNPAVYGSFPGPRADRTLLIYCHYDVKPAPAAGWLQPSPFEPVLRAGPAEDGAPALPPGQVPDEALPRHRLYGRGASDDKGPIWAHLTALELMQGTAITPRVGLKFIFDGDFARTVQIVANLVHNAAKYTAGGGSISIEVDDEGGAAVIRVRDTGIGLPAHRLADIFQPFVQLERGANGSQGGLGVGLTLVKTLVELHGGTVEAHSEGRGAGSEFVIRLPVVGDVPRLPLSSHAGVVPRERAGRRILVVDDNHDSADSLGLLLKITGNEVLTGYDGLEGVAAAETFRPDVVLLDIGMPRLSGYDACRRIREQPWGRNMLLIALTGWGQEEDKRQTEEAGFDAHLVKPVDPEVLTSLLASMPPRL